MLLWYIERFTHSSSKTTHPQSENIYAMLETLYGQMEKASYVLKTNLVLQNVEEARENIIFGHSVKLIISFVIINTIPGTPSVS